MEYCSEREGERLLKESDVLKIAFQLPLVVNSAFFDSVKALPSADRPQGGWIPASWQDENCPERLKRHKCSACGNRAKMVLVKTKLVDNYYCNKAEPITEYTHQEQLSDFCPNCGADMRGDSNESQQ